MAYGNTFLVSSLLILIMPLVFAQPRVAGGQQAVVGQFKFVVGIKTQVHFIDSEPLASTCTGSIIGKSWVLTAAHCMWRFFIISEIMGIKNMTKIEVVAGDINIQKAFEFNQTSGQLRYSYKYYMHPEAFEIIPYTYPASTAPGKTFMDVLEEVKSIFSSRFDLGLLQLDEPFTFDTNVGPITLATDYNSIDNQLNCTGVGFGSKNFSAERNVLLNYIPLTIGGIEYCKSEEPRLIGRTKDYFVCGKGKEEYDNMCGGDSGSPLICGEEGQEVQYGVASFTETKFTADYCGKERNIVMVYIFPNKAADWIDNIINGKPVKYVANMTSSGPLLSFGAKLIVLVVLQSFWDTINY